MNDDGEENLPAQCHLVTATKKKKKIRKPDNKTV